MQLSPGVHPSDSGQERLRATGRQEQGRHTVTLQPTFPARFRQAVHRSGSRACTVFERRRSTDSAIISAVFTSLLAAEPQAPILIECSAVTPKSFPSGNVASM